MGLFTRSKKLGDTGLLQGATDYHSHILPGVDDGFVETEKSFRALRYLEKMGLKKLWLTPHIMEDYPNTVSDLRERFDRLREAYDGSLEMDLASENMLDPLFEKRLRSGQLLPIGKHHDHLLVETSYFSAPDNFSRLIDEIHSAGYRVLLAHPERYIYMSQDDYKALKDKGVKFQINFGSIAGFYGKEAKQKAEWLLRNDFVNVFGSDMHRLRHLMAQLDTKVPVADVDRLMKLPEVML